VADEQDLETIAGHISHSLSCAVIPLGSFAAGAQHKDKGNRPRK
jgi:hypothetical protein